LLCSRVEMASRLCLAGTKYVISVTRGGIFRIRDGEPAGLIAKNIPGSASLCYDSGTNQMVFPVNPGQIVCLSRTANIQVVAEMILKETGGKIATLETKTAYPMITMEL
jgi:hypothetical protein